jgi:hypothetical protein
MPWGPPRLPEDDALGDSVHGAFDNSKPCSRPALRASRPLELQPLVRASRWLARPLRKPAAECCGLGKTAAGHDEAAAADGCGAADGRGDRPIMGRQPPPSASACNEIGGTYSARSNVGSPERQPGTSPRSAGAAQLEMASRVDNAPKASEQRAYTPQACAGRF